MIRTLIVDDDSLIHVTLRSLIDWESCGCTVVQDCSGGSQALSCLMEHPVDLLITDIKMPGMDGLELMRQLRQSGSIPVTVVLSGYDEFELVRACNSQAASCDGQRQERRKGAMQRAMEFMQDNFTNPELMLKTVADFVGFSEKYFNSRFTQECGCTFIGYLNDLRIGRAQELLLQTDMKIYEISDAVGYSSVEHFNHMFKKKLCMSPKDFRKTRD